MQKTGFLIKRLVIKNMMYIVSLFMNKMCEIQGFYMAINCFYSYTDKPGEPGVLGDLWGVTSKHFESDDQETSFLYFDQ